MKKIISILLIGLILFSYSSNVFASTITWKYITDKFVEGVDDMGLSATADDTNLTIVTADNEYEYSINFKYENNTISLIPRDKSAISEEILPMYSFIDTVMISAMFDILGDFYNLPAAAIDEENLTNYGIVLNTTEINYTNSEESGSVSMTSDYIDEFSINLNTFEETTRDLQGTSDSNNNNDENIITPETSVKLVLGHSNSNSLDLIAQVSNLPESSKAKCEIYMIPEEGTAFSSGESYIVGTINDCKNGNNKYTVSNLSSNSKYAFLVVLTEESSLGFTNQISSDKSVTFATIASSNATGDDNNITTNPKTGMLVFYITIIATIISAISFALLYSKSKKAKQTI